MAENGRKIGMEQEKIGFIGVGNMGGALAGAACAACGTSRVLVSDGTPERTRTIAEHLGAVCSDHATIATECRMIFLGVKPGLVQTVLAGILPVLEQRRDPVALVSMAAGVPISAVQSGMSEKKMPVIRIMPNTPVAVGEGMIVYTASPEVTKEDVLLLRQAVLCRQTGCRDGGTGGYGRGGFRLRSGVCVPVSGGNGRRRSGVRLAAGKGIALCGTNPARGGEDGA